MGTLERSLFGASVLALGVIFIRAYLVDVETEPGVSQATVLGPETPPAPPVREAPACPYTELTKTGFDRVIETPDTTLAGLGPKGGWFVMNIGTESTPLYQLGRVYPDGSIKLGTLVEDLTLLGPSTVPEVPKGQVFDPFDAYTLLSAPIPESEMGAWYTLPEDNFKIPEEYENGLERRSHSFNAPYEVGNRKVTDTEVRTVRDVVFDSVDYHDRQPKGVSDGTPCSRSYYADTSIELREHGEVLAVNEYPLLEHTDLATKEWVKAHELGHALSLIVHGEEELNALPVTERKRILEELKQLHEALKLAGKQYSLNTPREAIANVYAFLMKDPEFVKMHAPHAAQFFGGLVNDHPSLSRILVFK